MTSGMFISDKVWGSVNLFVEQNITVSTDFISGGGDVKIINDDPVIIRFKAHNEGDGGWGQVWWHFMVDGLNPGEEIILQLDRDEPKSEGISQQIYFSYDQNVWGLTNTGEPAIIESRDFFVYKHFAHGQKIWFAYDLPYTPEHIQRLLVPEVAKRECAKTLELIKSKNGRSVPYILIDEGQNNSPEKYGIFLQARTHAFESGSSWVLHELALWLISDDPEAKSLRACSTILIVPIVDVDGVVEGRTGKNHKPHDHNRGWDTDYWPETKATKDMLRKWVNDNMLDMFIDFHGPGNSSHPYFIVPFANKLPYKKQQDNREKFFSVLHSKPMDDDAKRSQSMTQIHNSMRPWDNSISSSREWVTMNTTDHNIAMTIEVNMNTPLSTMDGYRSEAITLGRAISNYFVHNNHQR